MAPSPAAVNDLSDIYVLPTYENEGLRFSMNITNR
jgi:hypothetical protein